MEKKEKLKMIVVALASLSALSVFFLYRRRRKCPQTLCYLRDDPKPQHGFKRVLADNSHSPFKHLNLEDSNGGGTLIKMMSLFDFLEMVLILMVKFGVR